MAKLRETLPFDLARAGAFYRDLFGGIEDLTQGKRLLIVPSGALTQLPFEVLVTAKPDETLPRFEAYKKAAWLGQRQAVTILPSVGSLKALRAAKASARAGAFRRLRQSASDWRGRHGQKRLGQAGMRQARAAEAEPHCHPRGEHRLAVPGRRGQYRGSAPAAAAARDGGRALRRCRELGVPEAGLSKAIYLGDQATVSKVKALSLAASWPAPGWCISPRTGSWRAKPLCLPRTRPSLRCCLRRLPEVSEEDNGLLTASEVAQLNLDADWVVMSACNTAAGSADGAEALSGLARAFFYAGARALLVSHWYVNSEAAVAITTGRGECHEGRAPDRPRRGAAPLHRRGRRQGRTLRASMRLGALRASRERGEIAKARMF